MVSQHIGCNMTDFLPIWGLWQVLHRMHNGRVTERHWSSARKKTDAYVSQQQQVMGQPVCLKIRCFHRYSPTDSLSSPKGPFPLQLFSAFHFHQVKETCLTRSESNSYTMWGCRRPSFGKAMDYSVLTQHCANKYLSWCSLGIAAPK